MLWKYFLSFLLKIFKFSLPFYIILIQVIFSEQNKLVLLAGEYKQIFENRIQNIWEITIVLQIR